MTRQLNQAGAGHVAVILAVILVAIVGFSGYRVVQESKKTPTIANTTSQTQTTTPSAITSTADVEQASKSLGSDQIDANLDESQLDADLNSLL